VARSRCESSSDGLSIGLRDDDQPAAVLILALPGIFDVGEGNRFSADAEFTAGGESHDPGQGVEYGLVRDTAAAAPVDLQSRAAQRGGGERDGRPGALADLDEADSLSLRGQVVACYGSNERFGGTTPQVVDDDVETLLGQPGRREPPDDLPHLRGAFGARDPLLCSRSLENQATSLCNLDRLCRTLSVSEGGERGGGHTMEIEGKCQRTL
jgi:hypothetical protein